MQEHSNKPIIFAPSGRPTRKSLRPLLAAYWRRYVSRTSFGRKFGVVICATQASICFATTVVDQDTAVVVSAAEFVGVVRVTGEKLIEANDSGSRVPCGFQLMAEVLDVVKGSYGDLSFKSAEPLIVGEKYVVALVSRNMAAIVLLSTSARAPSVEKAPGQAGQLCESKYPGLRTIDYTTSAFLAYGESKTGASISREDWVERTALANGPELKFSKIRDQKCMPESDGISVYESLHTVPSYAWYAYSMCAELLPWKTLRAHLTKALPADTHNKLLERNHEP